MVALIFRSFGVSGLCIGVSTTPGSICYARFLPLTRRTIRSILSTSRVTCSRRIIATDVDCDTLMVASGCGRLRANRPLRGLMTAGVPHRADFRNQRPSSIAHASAHFLHLVGLRRSLVSMNCGMSVRMPGTISSPMMRQKVTPCRGGCRVWLGEESCLSPPAFKVE